MEKRSREAKRERTGTCEPRKPIRRCSNGSIGQRYPSVWSAKVACEESQPFLSAWWLPSQKSCELCIVRIAAPTHNAPDTHASIAARRQIHSPCLALPLDLMWFYWWGNFA